MAGYKQGFGEEDFIADNPQVSVDPDMWRASIYSTIEDFYLDGKIGDLSYHLIGIS